MVKVVKVVISFLLGSYCVTFGQLTYDVNNIPISLLPGADAIIREWTEHVEIQSAAKHIYSSKKVVTIFNEHGLKNGHLYLVYDRFIKPNIQEAQLLDGSGKSVTIIKKTDFVDEALTSGGTLFNDNRILYYELKSSVFPITVVFQYQLVHHETLYLPAWQPLPSYAVALESAKFQVVYLRNNPVRYHASGLSEPPQEVIKPDGKTLQLTWSLKDLKAIQNEPFSPDFDARTPTVRIVPTEFSYDNNPGNSSSWKDFGIWTANLLRGRDKLPEATQRDMYNWSRKITNRDSLIAEVYKHVQTKTRYVSIQLGIGGFQPIPAETVDMLGYGDCKALTNYTKALLSAAGVESNYVVVGAGEAHQSIVYPDFPASGQLNHVILCIPSVGDTIWLECTSQTAPFGFLGSFTANRTALLIDSKRGGVLVRTPGPSEHDYLSRRVNLQLFEDGQAQVSINKTFSGLWYDEASLRRYKPEDQIKRLNLTYELAEAQFQNIITSEQKSRVPVAWESFDVLTPFLGRKIGSRMLVDAQVFTAGAFSLPADSSRTADLFLPYAQKIIDTVVIKVPVNWEISSVPPEVHLQEIFGSFSWKMEKTTEGFIIYRSKYYNPGHYPVSDYPLFYSFQKSIRKADTQKFLFRLKT